MDEPLVPQVGAPARALLDRTTALARTARDVLDHLDGTVLRIADTVARDREQRVRAELALVPVARIGDATDRNLRLGRLEDAGYRVAADLIGVPADALEQVPGVGPHTARAAAAAVEQLADVAREVTAPRLRLDRPDGAPDVLATTQLLALLARSLRLHPLVEPHRQALVDHVRTVEAFAPVAAPTRRRWRHVLARPATRRAARHALGVLAEADAWAERTGLGAVVEHLAAACAEPDPTQGVLWDDVESRPATYTTELLRLVPAAIDLVVERGLLAADLAAQVADHPLDTAALRVRLRGYQDFGARFLLHQGRALLGDEMGLGKTVQAIAAMAHVTAQGATHLLVVCPASVLVTWQREIERHSTLTPVRVHGPDAAAAGERWLRDGGVAVATYGSLRHVPALECPASAPVSSGPGGDAVPGITAGALGMLVVDEAHLVKNPRTARAREVRAWAARTARVALLTGTPMENRVGDFVELVRLVQPDLAAGLPRHLGLAGRDAFRRAVAPVYLRRDRDDVLVELPALTVVDEWEELTGEGQRAYRAAVSTGDLMTMRRVASVRDGHPTSGKLGRLLEIVADARAHGRRVVVFSWFRDVLDVVADALVRHGGATVVGPLTGDVPPQRRQEMVDELAALDASVGAVLVAQVQAGGVGLNLQCASVAVLCEPQLTPAAEAQAFARLHRMGQLRPVTAHRLLAEGTVDERLVALLADKALEFDTYVRDSLLAEQTVRAVDVTQADLARDVVAWEQAQWGRGPLWDAPSEVLEA
ncbi:DEAD/DEAH box helicase [Cellulomonas wangsupingiae]|uniref:DEAD/DEAH box helicase n=1 Tax=Cellulomonas wangsupingiae TaxID=2968085 RepID=A0ABY5K827_9CELL|nr:DEAD/DEAH box helicase [Cellulomonas wangsupingiae]MCC2335242.1 DEAD/DEAH box helicase [Cellulomonas wangsupingiae]UUI66619.1 DEAD/DEAH box helicase [Cellulomonas wangsupingiae]